MNKLRAPLLVFDRVVRPSVEGGRERVIFQEEQSSSGVFAKAQGLMGDLLSGSLAGEGC